MTTVREATHRYAFQMFEAQPPARALAMAGRIMAEGRKTRAQWTRLNDKIAAEPDDLEKVLLVCRRNGVAQTLNDISELLRDLREVLQTPATIKPEKESAA